MDIIKSHFKLSIKKRVVFVIITLFLTNNLFSKDIKGAPQWFTHPSEGEYVGVSIPFEDDELAEKSAEFLAILSFAICQKKEERHGQIVVYSKHNKPIGRVKGSDRVESEFITSGGDLESSFSNHYHEMLFSISLNYDVVKKERTKDGTWWVSIKPSFVDSQDSIIAALTETSALTQTSKMSGLSIEDNHRSFFMEYKDCTITCEDSSERKKTITFELGKKTNSIQIGWDERCNTFISNNNYMVLCPVNKDLGLGCFIGLVGFLSDNPFYYSYSEWNNQALVNIGNDISKGHIKLRYTQHDNEGDVLSNKQQQHQEIANKPTQISNSPLKSTFQKGLEAHNAGKYEEALSMFEEAAQKENDPKAMNSLGFIYEYGWGTDIDYKKSISWFKMAAENGMDQSQQQLALKYFYGAGVEKDFQQAFYWIEKAASQGNGNFQSNAGILYSADTPYRNYSRALYWLNLAIQQNIPEAFNTLAMLYEHGYGVDKNLNKAFSYYKQAADLDYPDGLNNLGRMYENGWGGAIQDYQITMELYLKAADKDNYEAMKNIGNMYEKGLGVKKNMVEALVWYKKAERGGNTDAKRRIEEYNSLFDITNDTKTSPIENRFIDKQIEQKKLIAKEMPQNEKNPSNSMINNINPALKRIALVIGNGDYSTGQLTHTRNDAKDISEKLKELGFETILRSNQTIRNMKTEISSFCQKAQNYDAALFYYAGHAMQDKGINYLVPIGASISRSSDIEFECVNLNWILKSLEDAEINTKIIILDACRDNPIARSWERGSISPGLTQTSVPKGTILEFSTQPGEAAMDGEDEDRNSPYAGALLQVLDRHMLPIHDVFLEVRKIVAQNTNNKQITYQINNLLGDFYFNMNRD